MQHSQDRQLYPHVFQTAGIEWNVTVYVRSQILPSRVEVTWHNPAKVYLLHIKKPIFTTASKCIHLPTDVKVKVLSLK